MHVFISISSSVSVQCGLDHTAQFYFSLVSFCLAADDFVYVYFYLALVVELAELSAEKPVLRFSLSTIEVLGSTAKN
jgi:hypothetical protein